MREIRISRNTIRKFVGFAIESCALYASEKTIARFVMPNKLISKIAVVGASTVIAEVVTKVVSKTGLTDDLTDLVVKFIKRKDISSSIDERMTDPDHFNKLAEEFKSDPEGSIEKFLKESTGESNEEASEETTETSDISDDETLVTVDNVELINGLYVAIGFISAYTITKTLIKLFAIRRLFSKITVAYFAGIFANWFLQNTKPILVYRCTGKEAIA